MLKIINLHVSSKKNRILNGINLDVKKGETHVIMGPNGSGKSTLSNVVAGNPNYKVIKGDILFEGNSILKTNPTKRALLGIFLAFQYPVSIPGINNMHFLKAIINAKRKFLLKNELDHFEFLNFIEEKMNTLGINKKFLNRFMNHGFSGGEKKMNEILQVSILKPKLSILDEIDSGLDVDSVKTLIDSINNLKSSKKSIIIITHYSKILNYINPNVVHIVLNGKIVKSGTKSIIRDLELKGYDNFGQMNAEENNA
jgi:Fe-S cluster assembly ATP-binding protein